MDVSALTEAMERMLLCSSPILRDLRSSPGRISAGMALAGYSSCGRNLQTWELSLRFLLFTQSRS